MSPVEKKSLQRRSNFLVCGAIFCAILLAVLPTLHMGNAIDWLTLPLFICLPACWLSGLSFFAASKGYSPIYGLLGLLALPGLLILGLLPDKSTVKTGSTLLTPPPMAGKPMVTESASKYRW